MCVTWLDMYAHTCIHVLAFHFHCLKNVKQPVSDNYLPRQSMDLLDDGCTKDILNPIGFLFAIRQILRIQEGGLAFFGLPCNSYGFMSRSLHGRSPDTPFGRPQFSFVQQGNILGARMCLLLILCVARGIRFMVENPDRSALGFFPYLVHIMSFAQLKPERIFWRALKLSDLACCEACHFTH